MKTNTNSTESTTESTAPTTTNTLPPPPAPVEKTFEEENFGYDLPPVVEEKKDLPPPPTAVADESVEKVEKPSTGYGTDDDEEEEKKEVTPPVEEKKEPATDEEKLVQEYNETVKDLPAQLNKDKVLKFATDNKFTKEQLAAYAEYAKKEVADMETAKAAAIKETRKQWKKELKEDPEFGGEQFDLNVDRAEKVLEKYLGNTKKVLTERGSVVPPYIMRDLAKLYQILNPTAPLVTGDPGAGDNESSFLDEMYK